MTAEVTEAAGRQYKAVTVMPGIWYPLLLPLSASHYKLGWQCTWHPRSDSRGDRGSRKVVLGCYCHAWYLVSGVRCSLAIRVHNSRYILATWLLGVIAINLFLLRWPDDKWSFLSSTCCIQCTEPVSGKEDATQPGYDRVVLLVFVCLLGCLDGCFFVVVVVVVSLSCCWWC